MSVLRCPRRYCGNVMELVTDGMGRVAAVCHDCARNRRGLCRDCPAPLPLANCMRCRKCGRARKLALDHVRDHARYPKRRHRVIARLKARYADPVWREHRRRYMAAYRAVNQHGPFQRAYQREYMRVRRADPAFRAQQNARKRALRAERRNVA